MFETILATALTITATNQKVTIDAVLDEAAWQDATVISQFWETFPGDNVEPSVKTIAYLMYDQDNLYLGFKCWDSERERIRAQVTDRDLPLFDDGVGISIDTFGDQLRMMDFITTPVGVQIDALFIEEAPYDEKWDAIWDSHGRLTDYGYEVEMAIPFKSLRFPNVEEQVWRVNIYRLMPREYFYSIQAAPNDRNRDCYVCQYRELRGIRGVKPGRHLEFIPTVTALRADERMAPGQPMVKGDEEVEGSLDVTWGLTSDTSAQATINPDFSQVEADVMEFEVNRRFVLQYPEKRPFFMEGTQYLKSPMDIIYTRSFADPAWGARVFGHEGKHTFGLIHAEDEFANFILPANESSSQETWEHDVSSSVFRYQFDFGRDSKIGAIATHRSGGSYHNALAGVDGRIRIGEHSNLSFQGLFADTQYPNNQEHSSFFGEEVDGHAIFLGYEYDALEWNAKAHYKELDPGFRSDLGFNRRVDIREAYGELQRVWWGDHKTDFYSQIMFTGFAAKVQDFGGRTTDEALGLWTIVQVPGQTDLEAGVRKDMMVYFDTEFERLRGWLKVVTMPARQITSTAKIEYGDDIDFLNRRRAKSLQTLLNVEWKPFRRITFDGTFRSEHVANGDGSIYDQQLYVARLSYYFSTRMYIRGLVQHMNIDYNPDNFLFPMLRKTNTLSTQLLYTYKINPFTLAYVGYSDSGFENDFIPSMTTNRSFFVKLSYAFRP